VRIFLCLAMVVGSSCYAFTQTPPASFLELLRAQLLASGLRQSITVNGTANWTAGSTQDSGPAKFTAKADGSTEIMLGLSKAARAETSTSLSSRSCQWIDSKGSAHEITGANCFRPIPWFSPVALPLLLSAPGVVVIDSGEVTDGGALRHQLIINPGGTFTGPAAKELGIAMQVTIYYDPTTLLPSSLEYSLHPDSNDGSSIPVRVKFSDYRVVSGLPVPFRIERSINRTLELTVSADSVVLN